MRIPFNPHPFIDAIAAVSRTDGRMPDPKRGIGRQCYAFSRAERRAFKVAEEAVRHILRYCQENVDFKIERTAMGSLVVTYYGIDRSLKPFMMGSHLDSVAEGGKYDGPAGVAAALAVLEATVSYWKEKPKRGFCVVIPVAEESSPKNSVACLGSSVLSGTIPLEKLQTIMYEQSVRLRDHLSASWEDILFEAQHPMLTGSTIAGCLEVHIEQGPYIAESGADIGIVTPAIGGAARYRVEHHPVRSARLKSGVRYGLVRIDFRGVAAHTGTTPPNPSFRKSLYRQDALVASCVAAQELLGAGALLVSSISLGQSGYTTVPAGQRVTMVVPWDRRDDVRVLLRKLARNIKQWFGVDMASYVSRHHISRNIGKVVTASDARRCLAIAPRVSELATKAYRARKNPFGYTRATVTDFSLVAEGLSFKLDVREVDHREGTLLVGNIFRTLDQLFHGSLKVDEVSWKGSQPVNQDLVRELKDVAESLGVKYIEIPSMAGHDADRFAAADIPVVMIFVRQRNGVSHTLLEDMLPADLDVAIAVAARFIERALSR